MGLKKAVTIILSVLYLSNVGLAQSNYSLVSYSGENGLSHNSVSSIVKDNNGFMWMATWDGLNRFDGTTFKVFKETIGRKSYLDSRRMIQIAEGVDDKLWILTYDKQVYWFDKKTEIFNSLSPQINDRAKKRVMFDRIFSVDKDFVWLGTENDGFYCISHKKLSGNSRSSLNISALNLSVNVLHKEENGNIWLGTQKGLFLLKRRSGRYVLKRISKGLPPNASVSKIAENKYGLYFVVNGGSVFYIDKRKRSVKRAWASKGTINQIIVSKRDDALFSTSDQGALIRLDAQGNSGQVVYEASFPLKDIFEDSKGNLWIDSHGGVVRFVRESGMSSIIKSPFYHINSSTIFAAFEDPNHTVWISMRGGGFGYFDEEKRQFRFSIQGMDRQDVILPQHVYNLYYDPEGIAWFSTENNGLVKLVIGDDVFKYIHVTQNTQPVWGQEVRTVMFDSRDRLWMGTKGGELFIREKEYVRPVVLSGIPKNGLGGVYSLLEDKKGNIWIGTKGNGLFKAIPTDAQRSSFELTHFHKANSRLTGTQVYSIYQDPYQRIWVGTFDDGLFLIEESGADVFFKKIEFEKQYNFGKRYEKIRHLSSDHKKNLWIASTNGLVICNKAGQMKFVRDEQSAQSQLGDNDVQFLYRGTTGDMWLCTGGGGITRVGGDAFGKLQFQQYSTEQGLCNDFVLSCAEDQQGFLWITTEGGLSKFDLKLNKFVNVDVNDGFKGLGFAEKAIAYHKNGEMVFGTSVGALSFDPRKLNHKSSVPQVVFSNFFVNNQDWGKIGLSDGKFVDIQYLKEVQLHYDQNNLTFDFGVTDHRYVHHNFSYRLIGMDSSWKQNGAVQRAAFTNLAPGTYYLEIKCESDLYTQVPFRRFKIVILPPWWHTWWAYLGYMILILSFIFTVRKFLFRLLKLKNEIILEQRLAEVKMEFFTNISHELRTPLTLILSPVKKLLSSDVLTSREKSYAAMIQNNARRLERFVNQLLDVRKLQEKKFELHMSFFELLNWLNSVIDIFKHLADEQKIKIRLRCNECSLYVLADNEKMEIVLYNLLSNALKFSPPNSTIEVYVRQSEDKASVMVDVIDQGPGVPEEDCDTIFDLFHVGAFTKQPRGGSSGVGLSFVKELIELHGGRVKAYNMPQGGLCVSFCVPMASEDSGLHLPVSEVIAAPRFNVIPGISTTPKEVLQNAPALNGQRPKLLIVEDNKELQQFLKLELEEHYIVHGAQDGVEGWDKVSSLSPDLIISDIMMPNRNGMELLALVRENEQTSHIPFILLTAKHAVENQIEGLQYGADYYITKPFDTNFLLASVANLLAKRRNLFDSIRYGVEDILKPQQVIMTSRDERFLKEVVRIVDARLGNPEFNVDDLTSQMGLGRNTFYRKFKSLTNLTPVEFLRDMRLDKAKLYLEGGMDNVAEVAYLVGFNDPKYFSKCFKARFNCNPKEFYLSLG